MRLKDIKQVYHHPLNRKRKLISVCRYFKIAAFMRVFRDTMFEYPFVENTKLLVGRKSYSSLGQYLNGLNDFEEMSLLLHFLTEKDTFVDIGANVGVYSILASGVKQATSIAIEPSEDTTKILRQNILLNNLEHKISHIKCIVGNENKKREFTKGMDVINRVEERKSEGKKEIIDEMPLDTLIEDRLPSMIKVDTEGFELNVLKGAGKTLKKPQLKILLIETNGLSERYGLNQNDISKIMHEHGFSAYRYFPFERKLTPVAGLSQNNTIFVRDLETVNSILRIQEKIEVNQIWF